MKKTTSKKAAPAKTAPLPKSAPKALKAPAKKAAKPAKKQVGEPPVTFISAQIDIGFGNHLFLRGEGPGLSWNRGLAMDCTGAGLWTASVKHATQPVVFKVLVNDLSWSSGDDFVAAAGQSVTVTPSF
jgi:hypothetical protein